MKRPGPNLRRQWLGVVLLLAAATLVWAALGFRKWGQPATAVAPVASSASGSILEDEKTVFRAYAGSASCQPCHEEIGRAHV